MSGTVHAAMAGSMNCYSYRLARELETSGSTQLVQIGFAESAGAVPTATCFCIGRLANLDSSGFYSFTILVGLTAPELAQPKVLEPLANITIIPLLQRGHIAPTLPLAFQLMQRGHSVTYLKGEGESTVEQGLHPQDILESLQSTFSRVEPGESSTWQVSAWCRAIQSLSTDLVLIDRVMAEKFFPANDIFPCQRLVYSTSLLDWGEPLSLSLDEPIVLLCPEQLEVPQFRHPRKRLFYADPFTCASQQAVTGMVDLNTSCPKVLCAFGTQSLRHTKLREHYNLVLQVASRVPTIQFVLAAPHQELLLGANPPKNVLMFAELPQQEVLRNCCAFITHGGLGSVKEAVLAGVPMLVLPSFGDQFFNGMRVRYSGLGEALYDDAQTVPNACNVLERIVDGAFTTQVEAMRRDFRARLAGQHARLFVEGRLRVP